VLLKLATSAFPNYIPAMNKDLPISGQGRRQFIKTTSLAVGASVFGGAYVIQASSAARVQGTVRSGNGPVARPLQGASVSLYEATVGTPRLLGVATTDAGGYFAIQLKPGSPNSKGIFYATADLGRGVQLVSIIGPELADFVTINELTTVAAGYAAAQFVRAGVLAGAEFGLRLAAGMNNNLVDGSTGESSPVLLSSPNGDETNSLRSTRALANLLAFFVRDAGQGIAEFFALATPPGGLPPVNILQALSNIARFPEQNVADIFALTVLIEVYSPALVQVPDAWTIVVKVNDSGSDAPAYFFGGPGNLVFDANGYAWVTNNVTQGTPYSGQFSIVLKPDGKPADGKGGTPKSPLVGGGILGPGFGVDIAPNGNVWIGNFGWGGDDYNPSPDGNGSVSVFSKHGKPLSGALGIQGGVDRAQGVAADADGNIWICSVGNDRVVVFLKGDPNRSIYFPLLKGSAPFDVQIAADGTAWVSISGGFDPTSPSHIARFRLVNGQIRLLSAKPVGTSVKGISLDSQGQAWVPSGSESLVYLLSRQGDVLGSFSGGGVFWPWSTSVDGDDNVWVANFGPIEPGTDFTNTHVTKLAGSNPATRPPGLNTGDPISPPSGYTLPSAGDQVLLPDGTPLYGQPGPPSFSPLMRLTNVVIDQAGNVWAINNWKPSFDNDAKLNPGGDGICIFVGLATPTRR
jgi:hypothetical protein